MTCCCCCGETIVTHPLYGWVHDGAPERLWCRDSDGIPSQSVAEPDGAYRWRDDSMRGLLMAPISFRGRDGVRRFAFDRTTDPLTVLVELAWAYARSVPICGYACPSADGGYCCDCHMVASAARDTAQERMAA